MDITKPTLFVDLDRCRANIRRMAEKARKNKLVFRPHFKTHQSAAIGELFRAEGVEQITVSSISMAKYFAAAGWNDITVAFPTNVWEIEDIKELASKIKLNLTIESLIVAEELATSLEHEVGIYIKVDCGYGRTGIRWEELEGIGNLAMLIREAPNLNFHGLLTHAGHSYNAKSPEAVLRIHKEYLEHMQDLKDNLKEEFPDLHISIGDTPTCSIADEFGCATEMRPGNFVFYDIWQHRLGACQLQDIAVALAVPVVSTHIERSQLVVYGGAVHLSKDHYLEGGGKIFGWVCEPNERGWGEPLTGIKLVAVSQEHGVIKGNWDWIRMKKPGDLLYILPVHSCLTANLMGAYKDLDGETIEVQRAI